MDDQSQAQTDGLTQLAAKFGNLTAAEQVLLNQAPIGDWAKFGPKHSCDDPQGTPTEEDDADPLNNPKVKEADNWGSGRQIRAALLAWLCTNEQARKHVHARGIQVHGADITGPLNLSFVIIPFPLSLQHCRVESIDLRWAEVPLLKLSGSQVGGVTADGIVVKDDVLLDQGFTNEGELSLDRARIDGTLDCRGGSFSKTKDFSLSAYRITVKSSVFLTDGFKAIGNVRLIGAQIGGGFNCNGGNFKDATLDLTSASAAALYDSGLDEHPGPECKWTIWPPGDKDRYLQLEGFTYGRISSKGQVDVEKRLDWLALQPQLPFHTQPYVQLAKVLRESGDENGAKKVLIKMEALSRKGSVLSPILECTIGYGYDPILAFWWAAGLTGLGWIIYRRSYLVGGMVPTEQDACTKFRKPGAPVPDHYPNFSPLVYSMENSLPLVKLGQGDKWQPDPEPNYPREKPGPRLGYRGGWRTPKSTADTDAHDASATSQPVASASSAATPSPIDDGATAVPTSTPESPPISRRRFFGPLESALIAVGMQSSADPKHVPSSLSRFGTSPRFVTWFLWFQILLGWLLATLFVAGVTGIVHKD
jgi:hypothetical protein